MAQEPITPPQPAAAPAPSAASEAQTAPAQTSAPASNNPVDFGSILLPKKDAGPSPLSAQRVNAAAELEAITAPLEPTAPKPVVEQIAKATEYAKEAVPALHTYKTDVQETVEERHISLLDMAAAQAKHSAQTLSEEAGSAWKKVLAFGAGALLLLAAFGIAGFVYLHQGTTAAPARPSAALMYVDESQPVYVREGASHDETIQNLQIDRTAMQLSLGLIAQLDLRWEATSTSGTPVPLSTQDVFAVLAPTAPDSLVRSLSPQFLLGIHAFDDNQPFLLLQTDSYTQAYAGMLAWEPTMQSDLSPLFSRTPSPTLTSSTGTSTPATSTTPAVQTPFLQSPFVDQVVDNHDARVIKDQSGNVLLLWTFIGRSTLVITTDPQTLQEIISRLSTAPVVPVPGS